MRNRATTPLSKPRVRQSWNKYNLYNLSRIAPAPYKGKTFYQQKWKSKSVLRDYHGEQVREGQWTRMFRRTLPSVIPMDPAYLAQDDGTRESAGRGSGLIDSEIQKEQQTNKIPYMAMTFAPLERRLDTAIFRAMFASSARQARQFVVHGAVTVNGKSMRYPGYLLNPGDMFQVNSERVMYATGQPKGVAVKSTEAPDEEAEEKPQKSEEIEVEEEEEMEIEDPRQVLKELLSRSRSILASPRDKLGAKKKQDLRAFASAVRRVLSRSQSSTILTESLEAQFQEIQNQLKIAKANKQSGRSALPSEQSGAGLQARLAEKDVEGNEEKKGGEEGEDGDPVLEVIDGVHMISDRHYATLFQALTEMQENPMDDSKPYATPWSPRDYMSAFAFIPRYLEVNQNICAAVYLRHPVAKPGLAEVPTPFDINTSGSAYSWYLRRR